KTREAWHPKLLDHMEWSRCDLNKWGISSTLKLAINPFLLLHKYKVLIPQMSKVKIKIYPCNEKSFYSSLLFLPKYIMKNLTFCFWSYSVKAPYQIQHAPK